MSKTTNNNTQRNFQVTVVHDMRDYSKDPYFVKKLEKAKAFIEKNGLPKGWEIKKDS